MNFKIAYTFLIGMVSASCAFGQNRYDYGNDSASCVQNLSLYQEYAAQEAYKDALTPWSKALKYCPQSRKSIYVDGVKMYRSFIQEATEKTEKEALIDSLMMVYDKRIVNFGQEGYVLGRKGSDLFRYRKDKAATAAKDILKKSIDLQKENSEASVLSTYYQALYASFQNGESEKADLLTEYLAISEYVDFGIMNSESDRSKEDYEKAKNNMDELFITVAECDEIVEILGARIKLNPDDHELKKKTLRILNKRDCADSDAYLPLAKSVHSVEPSHESAYSIGVKSVREKNFSDALKYFAEAADLCNHCPQKADYLLKAGQSASALQQSQTARSFANKVLAIEPNNGAAYVLIGDAVFMSAAGCDDGKLGTASAYWLAYDYYAKAKTVDRSVADIASRKMGTCQSQFPSKEVLFGHVIKEGDAYTVTCWGENTTARNR